jgi:alkanesulfonate monooxygenase SsuD/methylene tetrahydromethanopterin reductase-like flavin-dependent oxidoreductase (luciferase family)
VLGVGTGYQADDFAPFGVPRGERGRRMDAALDELERLLGDGDDAITPPPSSRPPVWIGAWSDVGLARAARRDGWIADPIRSVTEVADMAGRFRALGDGSGSVIVMREAWVDGAPGAAERFAEVIAPVFRYYRRNGAADLPEDPGELAADRFVVGSAASCVEQVADIGRRTGADVVVLTLRQPHGPSHDTVMHAIDALGRARAEVAA